MQPSKECLRTPFVILRAARRIQCDSIKHSDALPLDPSRDPQDDKAGKTWHFLLATRYSLLATFS